MSLWPFFWLQFGPHTFSLSIAFSSRWSHSPGLGSIEKNCFVIWFKNLDLLGYAFWYPDYLQVHKCRVGYAYPTPSHLDVLLCQGANVSKIQIFQVLYKSLVYSFGLLCNVNWNFFLFKGENPFCSLWNMGIVITDFSVQYYSAPFIIYCSSFVPTLFLGCWGFMITS